MQEKLENNQLISVVIPVFNGEKYISHTLDSIIQFNEFHDSEVIIVNDGSTDKTLEIIKDYANKYNNIKIINKEKEGVSIARNLGIKSSYGRYIAFVDADDIWHKNHLTDKITFLDKNQNAFGVTSFCEIINQDGILTGEIKKGDYLIKLIDVLKWKGNYITIPSGILFRRECLLNNGFNSNLSNNADQEIIMRHLNLGYSFYTLKEVTWQYRRHSLNMSSNIEILEKDTIFSYQLAVKNNYFTGDFTKNACYSKMAFILALCWLKDANNYPKAFSWLVKSFVFSPVNFIGEFLNRMFGNTTQNQRSSTY